MHDKVLTIAQQIKKHFLSSESRKQEFFIFLCGGGDVEQLQQRREIGQEIASIRSKYRYSAYYPEDMFVELIMGHNRKDLLSLENMLAESAHAVGIIVESPGTCAELGAFANHERLRNKLILVIEPKYEKKKSFINLGPIRYLRTRSKSKIHYLPINHENSNLIASVIVDSCREISKHSKPVENLTNPIYSYDFYLALIFVLDPIPRQTVLSIAVKLSEYSKDKVIDAGETVVNTLINEGSVSCISGELSSTEKGGDRLIYSNRTQKSRYEVYRFLTTMRYKVLNELYRGKIGTRGKAFDI